MSNNDLNWIHNLVKSCQWPTPANTLKHSILTRTVGVQIKQQEENFHNFFSGLIQPKIASSLAFMLLLGICVGAIILPKSSAEAHTNLYMDSDLTMLQSIVFLERSVSNE